MNIQTVAENLKNTIAGKEQLYANHAQEMRKLVGSTEEDSYTKLAVCLSSMEYLRINIDELRRILGDVEQCLPQIEHDLDGPLIKMFRED
jgi:hypothetical protein